MKAISIRQPWASQIADGTKIIEYRSWPTSYRGPLLVCASARPVVSGVLSGVAICVIDVVGCRLGDDGYEWDLARPRPVKPVPIKGRLSFFTVADELIQEVSAINETVISQS
jgi:hypothetical protein